MKKWNPSLFGLILVLLIFLAGCNIPRIDSTPTVDVIGTQVSQILTSQPTFTLPPTPHIITGTSTTTPETTTATPESTTTLTPVSTDPRQILGEPSYENPMEKGSTWGLGNDGYKDDYVQIKMDGGFLKMQALQAAGWHSWRLGGEKFQNGYIEATLKTGNCSGNDMYGIVLRAPDYDSGRGYYLGLTCDGQYNLSVWTSSSLEDLLSWTSSDSIHAGSNQTNRLGAWVEGNQWKLYINGFLLQEINDSSILNDGYFGYFIAANQTVDFIFLWMKLLTGINQ